MRKQSSFIVANCDAKIYASENLGECLHRVHSHRDFVTGYANYSTIAKIMCGEW